MESNSKVIPSLEPQKYTYLKGRCQTDLLDLDRDVSEMGTLMQMATEHSGIANEMRDSAKEDLSIVVAVVSNDLRKIPANATGKSKSEAQVESEYLLDDRYLNALSRYQNARLDSSLWSSMVDGMRKKSDNLYTATDLFKLGYITTSSISDKRRSETRMAVPPSERVQLNKS